MEGEDAVGLSSSSWKRPL